MNAKLKIAEQSSELLNLGTILVGSLPATLMTADAPERYTVEAVFTRRVDREEAAAIQSATTHDHLAANGYPTVELRVSDRRLEIAGTSLQELRDGLASVIARRLVEISAALRDEREVAAHRFQDEADREAERAAAIAVLAASVRFEADQSRSASDDDARIDDWVEEGGALRG